MDLQVQLTGCILSNVWTIVTQVQKVVSYHSQTGLTYAVSLPMAMLKTDRNLLKPVMTACISSFWKPPQWFSDPGPVITELHLKFHHSVVAYGQRCIGSEYFAQAGTRVRVHRFPFSSCVYRASFSQALCTAMGQSVKISDSCSGVIKL